MRITWYSGGIEHPILTKLEEWEEPYVEKDSVVDIPPELYDRWVDNQKDLFQIIDELDKLYMTQTGKERQC